MEREMHARRLASALYLHISPAQACQFRRAPPGRNADGEQGIIAQSLDRIPVDAFKAGFNRFRHERLSSCIGLDWPLFHVCYRIRDVELVLMLAKGIPG
jgi:hypothetical protein